MIFIIFLIVFAYAIWFTIYVTYCALRATMARQNMKKNVMVDANVIGTNQIPIAKLADLNIDDIKLLEDYLYDLFLKFECALNSLDYNTMNMLTTSKLYNLYHTDISLNVRYGRKKIIKDIKRKKVLVYDTFISDERQMIYAIIEVEYISYTISKDGKIISGIDEPVTEKFDVVFTKKYSSNDVIKCPNCGNTVLGSTCSYCRTELRNQNFKMESIKRIINNH